MFVRPGQCLEFSDVPKRENFPHFCKSTICTDHDLSQLVLGSKKERQPHTRTGSHLLPILILTFRCPIRVRRRLSGVLWARSSFSSSVSTQAYAGSSLHWFMPRPTTSAFVPRRKGCVAALTDDTEFRRHYWFGSHCESQRAQGVLWRLISREGI